jgi:hypothetical protein
MVRSLFRCGALALVVGVGACKLVVTNPNQPETARVLKTPADVESLLGTQYLRYHSAFHSSLSNVWGMANVQSFEDYSSLSNNCMGQRVGIPRASNDNTIGNGCGTEQQRTYYIHAEVARTASNVIAKLNTAGFSLGSTAQDARARAFAEFLRGLSLGYIALVYDSGAVVTPAMSTQDPGVLTDYNGVMAEALVALQNAIDAANATVSGSNGFPLPSTWLPGPTSLTATEFIKLVRSYRARFRANVARTPAERAAVNWDAVIADAQNGITADHYNTTNTTTGPFNTWVAQFMAFTTWHQMTPFVIGMADNSGAYQAWLAQPLGTRGGVFTMVTADQRFPQGATRVAQQADLSISTNCTAAAAVCKRYFTNRPTGNDVQSGDSWGWSNYDFVRFYPWATKGDGGTAQNGNFPFFTKAELDLLQAEGQYRKGNYGAAAALVNVTRTACGFGGLPAGCTTRPAGNGTSNTGGGLPAAPGDATSLVPGGANCVPQVPQPPNFTTTACGTLWEALKWEKRIETAYTHPMAWYFDSRGWGDLPQGTGYQWPVPYQDLLARGRTGAGIYSTGGPTGYSVAARGTYGW